MTEDGELDSDTYSALIDSLGLIPGLYNEASTAAEEF